MTTTAARDVRSPQGIRTAAPARPTSRRDASSRAPRQTTAAEVRGARLAGVSLLVVTLLAVPAATVVGAASASSASSAAASAASAAPDGTAARLAGVAFLLVAVLDVLAGWGLHLLLRRRATPASTATLVSRAGYAVLLAGSAAVLAWPGGAGATGFAREWSVALVVFGLHLVIAGTALWRTRIAPRPVALVTVLAGVAYLLDDVLTRLAEADASAVLVPLMLGELVLVGWLLLTARRGPTTA